MDLKKFQKVFTLYLKGLSYAEIEKSAGVPKSTVQRWIQDFRNGEIGIYKDMLPYVEELATVGKFMRESGLELPDIKSAAVIASIVKSLGIGINDLIETGNALKDINSPDTVREVTWTVTNLIGKGVKPSDLQQRIDSMRKEMGDKEEELSQITVSIHTQDRAEQEAKERVLRNNQELAAMKKSLDDAKKDLESARKEKEELKDIIENANKFDKFIEKNEIDLNQLIQLHRKARMHNFDIKRIISLSNLEYFWLDNDIGTPEISDFVKSLDGLYRKGWDFHALSQLDMVTENTGIKPADAVDDLLRYYKETELFKNSVETLKKKEQDLKESLLAKAGEYSKLEEECNRITAEEKEAQRQKELLEKEISTLMQTRKFVESGITAISQISSKISEKRSELSRIENQFKAAEETLNGIRNEIDIESVKVKAAQEFFDLMKFGTPDTVESLKYSIDRALNSENGNMNQKGAADRYRYARETAIKLLMEIAGDGIGGIRYFNTAKLRFIEGNEYDDLVSYRSRLSEVYQKENEIRQELKKIHDGISEFISNIVAGRLKPRPEVDNLIVRITENVIREQLKREAEDAESYKSIVSQLQDNFNLSAVTIKGLDRDSKLPVAGFIYPVDFAGALQSGEYVRITNGKGCTNFIDLCTAIRQILLHKFNYNFYRQLQEAMSPGKITIVRSTFPKDSNNKQDKKVESQHLQQQRRLHGGFVYKNIGN